MNIPSSETSAWNIAEGSSEGQPKLIRYRPDLESFIGSEKYPQRLVIVWEYEIENSSGMPSEQLIDEMKILEDALVGALDPDRLAILAFVLTKNGCREWHYYVSNVQEAGSRINTALSGLHKFPIHLQIEDDPHWEEMSAVYCLCQEKP